MDGDQMTRGKEEITQNQRSYKAIRFIKRHRGSAFENHIWLIGRARYERLTMLDLSVWRYINCSEVPVHRIRRALVYWQHPLPPPIFYKISQ